MEELMKEQKILPTCENLLRKFFEQKTVKSNQKRLKLKFSTFKFLLLSPNFYAQTDSKFEKT